MKVIFASGSSGGHFFPSLSYARLLRRERVEVVFFVNREDFSRVLSQEGFKNHVLAIKRCRYSTFLEAARSLVSLTVSFIQSLRFILKEKPAAVCCFGGFSSLGPGVATILLRKKLILHEQNVLYGKVNRLLAPFASKVGVQRWTEKRFPRKEIPLPLMVRGEFTDFDLDKDEAKRRLGLDPGLRTLLFMGGSSGSHFINTLAKSALKYFDKSPLQFIIVSGSRDYRELQELVESSQMNKRCKVYSFVERIWEVLRASDVAVIRAGILSIYEVLYEKIYPVFIPYPYAGKHQVHNAFYFVKRGAGAMFTEDEKGEVVFKHINEVLSDFESCRDQIERVSDVLIVRDEDFITKLL